MGVLIVLLVMAAISWTVHAGYARLLRGQWQTEATTKAKRLTDDFDSVYTRLEVFARCQLEAFGRLTPSQITHPKTLSTPLLDTALMEEMGILEVVARPVGRDEFYEFYNRNRISPAKVWRGSLYDMTHGGVPQSVLEITEYGPRLLVQLPFVREDGEWILEVSMGLDDVLTNFARSEGCEAALLIPQGRWAWGAATPVVGAHGEGYVVAASTHPKAAELLGLSDVRRYIGREAYGLFQGTRPHEALGMLFLAGLEYQSPKVPVVGPTPSLVLWSDYAPVLDGLNSSRRGILATLWIVGGLVGGIVGYFLIRLRRQASQELLVSAASVSHATLMLQSEVTARQQTEEKLRQIADSMYMARQSDQRLMGTLAHQLKVTAAGIVGYASLSADDAREWAEAREEILRSGQRILLSAQNLDVWARRAELARAVELHPLALSTVFDAVVGPFREWLVRKNIAVERAIPQSLMISADALLFEVIVRSVVANAVSYAPLGSRIKVSARELAEGVELSIADEGAGLSAQQMEKIFDLPEELCGRGTAGEEGLGLGLRLVHWAAMATGVQVKIFSSEGAGCRVVLIFPAAVAPRRA